MRRQDKAVTDPQELLSIIEACPVCRIATQDEAGLYIVPMNFGYRFENGQLTLYVHSAKAGRKIEAFRKNSHVAFEMDCDLRLITGEVACRYSLHYRSIIGSGLIQLVEDPAEKKLGLSLLMKHQTGKDFEFSDGEASRVLVYRIEISEFCGKQSSHG